ncbi:hypothetical protein Peur_054618 [Populus x canadensis]|uniref:Ubiquitin-like protease family profile domain-containing protein n=1 Tax=Populus deltoides TaxID=3696 RepID=A0A8T2XVB5_POPDE|nr:hypothetical protein H0E87_019510 [Populus deltoides]KAH8496793.1 hypothetical protein H0E87_019510 [Populus deltoides]
MGRTRRTGRKTRPHGGGVVTIDLESEGCTDQPSKHRTCWKHIQARMHARRTRMTKKQAEEIESFKLTSPCFLQTIPCRERSKKRFKRNNAVSKLKKELDSVSFNCYMENLWKSFSEDKKMSFAYLDSLWFTMYTEASSGVKVLEWIKRKHIFSKKYVLVPIVRWCHWSLLIFCHFGESLLSENITPCMLLLDSLEMASPKRLEPDIRKFVWDIYESEGRPENKHMISQIPLLVPKVPQQRNGVECGNYVLYFINLFVQDAPENFHMEGYPYFMKDNWFSPEGLEHFCEKLESLESDIL